MRPPPICGGIKDLGRDDFLKVDCPACHHVGLLTPDALLRGGLTPRPRFSTLTWTVPVCSTSRSINSLLDKIA
jgi:hypothetical protein